MRQWVKYLIIYGLVATLFGTVTYKLVVARHETQNKTNASIVEKKNKKIEKANDKIMSGSSVSELNELIKQTFVGGANNAQARRNAFLSQDLLQNADWLVSPTADAWRFAYAGAYSTISNLSTAESNGKFVTRFEYNITQPNDSGNGEETKTTVVVMTGETSDGNFIVDNLVTTQP